MFALRLGRRRSIGEPACLRGWARMYVYVCYLAVCNMLSRGRDRTKLEAGREVERYAGLYLSDTEQHACSLQDGEYTTREPSVDRRLSERCS